MDEIESNVAHQQTVWRSVSSTSFEDSNSLDISEERLDETVFRQIWQVYNHFNGFNLFERRVDDIRNKNQDIVPFQAEVLSSLAYKHSMNHITLPETNFK